ncbi:hypothetical protein EJ08DRAFT_682030 [Tothia fuscella]|uniref:Uncharacterized protein n=1 Tax=Tothia fuscella TaxID=1048955 RepID=A0A9P4NJZ0_9PEZI|nr:hypothetical protein EJ08DRAFT_682030 [Tothia fuscella]
MSDNNLNFDLSGLEDVDGFNAETFVQDFEANFGIPFDAQQDLQQPSMPNPAMDGFDTTMTNPSLDFDVNGFQNSTFDINDPVFGPLDMGALENATYNPSMVNYDASIYTSNPQDYGTSVPQNFENFAPFPNDFTSFPIGENFEDPVANTDPVLEVPGYSSIHSSATTSSGGQSFVPSSDGSEPPVDGNTVEQAAPAPVASGPSRAGLAKKPKRKDRSGEKPKTDCGRREARINRGTKGGSRRTTKVNDFDPRAVYEDVPHPMAGSWSTRGNKTFTYNQANELSEPTFSWYRLNEFIRQHPTQHEDQKHWKLSLFIQKGPADSTRRYHARHADKCRFKECPSYKYGFNGTIMHGHMRVALDELSFTHGDDETNDPFLCAGFVHLYCLERFLNLPEICRLPHIRVIADTRTLIKEPEQVNHARLQDKAAAVAMRFIRACKNQTTGERWVQEKDHTKTLNWAMQNEVMPQRSRTVRMNKGASTLKQTTGDLEVALSNRRANYKKKATQKRARDESDDEDAEGDDDDNDDEEAEEPPSKRRRRIIR